MKLSNQRRISVAVLGLALAALFVDRVILGGGVTSPRAATASQSAGEAHPAIPADPATLPVGPAIAERLENFRARADPSTAPDGFAVVASWYKSAARPAGEVPGARPSAERFKLGGVMTDGAGNPCGAFINRKRLSIGDSIDGARLVSARGALGNAPAAVELEIDGRTVTVEMPGPLSQENSQVRAVPSGRK